MCSFTYWWYYCNHGTYAWEEDIEFCSNRLLSCYSYDAWCNDMCENLQVICGGFSNYYCDDCSEDIGLEFELDDL